MMDFQDRLADALRRRLYPNTGLHLKQLAAGIGCSQSSVQRWWRGVSDIRAVDLERIARFFARRGDTQFIADVFGEVLPARAADFDADELVQLLRRMLDTLPRANELGPAPGRTWWVTNDGIMIQTPRGHGEYVAHTLGLPVGAGNLARYAIVILGWIAISIRDDGVIVVRHDGRRVAPLAAERLGEWLLQPGTGNPAVVRYVHLEGKWLAARYDSAELAAEAIQRVAFIVTKPRRPWIITRLPVDTIADGRLQQLLRLHAEAPERLIETAAASGALTDTSIFSVAGNDVICQSVPSHYRISRQGLEGRNVMSMSDTDYALMARTRLLMAAREGPVYYELEGTLNDEFLHYYNLAIPQPGPTTRVIAATVVIRHEILS